jgi:ABC-type glycerol-3-phosphate transport system substrate-binding protein
VTTSKTLVLLTAAALITAGCGGSNSSDSASSATSSTAPSTVNPSDMSNDQAPPNRLNIDVDIKGGNVTPTNQQLKAGVKEQIIIHVNSDAADELHVHSTPEHKFNVEAKPMQVFQFTVDVPGKVDVELHHLDKTIATITVQ